jgi:hypothetical protein
MSTKGCVLMAGTGRKARRRHSLVGKRIKDFWDEDKQWYTGTVLEYRSPEVITVLWSYFIHPCFPFVQGSVLSLLRARNDQAALAAALDQACVAQVAGHCPILKSVVILMDLACYAALNCCMQWAF